MSLELTKNHPVLNGEIISVNNITPASFISLLNSSPRIVKLEMGISIYIFDELGIRFWERNNLVTEAEFLLEESSDAKRPHGVFQGSIFLNGIFLSRPIFIKTIQEIEGIEVTLDDDSSRFGMNIYHVSLENRKYSFWVDKENVRVTSIHI